MGTMIPGGAVLVTLFVTIGGRTSAGLRDGGEETEETGQIWSIWRKRRASWRETLTSTNSEEGATHGRRREKIILEIVERGIS
jgi:hypothetical protein